MQLGRLGASHNLGAVVVLVGWSVGRVFELSGTWGVWIRVQLCGVAGALAVLLFLERLVTVGWSVEEAPSPAPVSRWCLGPHQW